MIEQTDQLPIVLTSFAFKEECFTEYVTGQEVLNQILKIPPHSDRYSILIRLDTDKYCAIADNNGTFLPGIPPTKCVMARN